MTSAEMQTKSQSTNAETSTCFSITLWAIFLHGQIRPLDIFWYYYVIAFILTPYTFVALVIISNAIVTLAEKAFMEGFSL